MHCTTFSSAITFEKQHSASKCSYIIITFQMNHFSFILSKEQNLFKNFLWLAPSVDWPWKSRALDCKVSSVFIKKKKKKVSVHVFILAETVHSYQVQTSVLDLLISSWWVPAFQPGESGLKFHLAVPSLCWWHNSCDSPDETWVIKLEFHAPLCL